MRKVGWKAAQSFRDLNELFVQGTISKSQVERWFKNFKSGDTNLADEKGIGRPSNYDDQALLDFMEEDESLTSRMFAKDFNVDHSTIDRRLKKLGKNMEIGLMGPPRTLRKQQNRTSLNFHPFAAEKRANSVLGDSRHWG